jgi:hypothetical protein
MTTWFSSQDIDKYTKLLDRTFVNIGHVAAMYGMTKSQYLDNMVRQIKNGDLMVLLREEAQFDLSEWIMSKGRYDDGGMFYVMFSMSADSSEDTCLICNCWVDMSGNEPSVRTRGIKVVPYSKVVNMNGTRTDMFEIGICDLSHFIKEDI